MNLKINYIFNISKFSTKSILEGFLSILFVWFINCIDRSIATIDKSKFQRLFSFNFDICILQTFWLGYRRECKFIEG